ncbi:MAG: glycosyltransferase [Oscillospiraceae bacterium]
MEKQNLRDGLLSVVVPVYKVEAYLDRCVESIVNQTYTKLEIILVDDGSPDRCPELCDEWAKRDSRIRVIHKDNGGLSDARNTGIAAAIGEYLAFVDSDDYIDHCMYETMIETMSRTNAGIVCCGRYVVKGNVQISLHSMEKETVFTSQEAIQELLIGGSVEEATWDKLYRAELFEGIYFPLGEINEDIVIMPTLLRRAEKIVHVGRPFYYYWQNSASITRSAYSEKKRIMLDHLDAIKAYLEEMYPELICYFDVLQSRYCQSALYLLLDNESTYREFHDDYLAFYRRFQKSFKNMLKLVSISREEKIKGYLIYYRAYYWMHLLKSRMRK